MKNIKFEPRSSRLLSSVSILLLTSAMSGCGGNTDDQNVIDLSDVVTLVPPPIATPTPALTPAPTPALPPTPEPRPPLISASVPTPVPVVTPVSTPTAVAPAPDTNVTSSTVPTWDIPIALQPDSGITSSINNVLGTAVGDLNGDGLIDLVAVSRDTGLLAWYENSGGANPSFTEHIIAQTLDLGQTDGVPGQGKLMLEIADFDGDGYIDILQKEYERIYWYRNVGQRPLAFAKEEIFSIRDREGGGHLFLANVGGLQGNDNMGVFAYGYSRAFVSYIYYEDQQLKQMDLPVPFGRYGDSIYTASQATDIEGDGDTDLIVVDVGFNVTTMLNSGDSRQLWSEQTVGTGYLSALEVVNMDEDPEKEVLVSGFSDIWLMDLDFSGNRNSRPSLKKLENTQGTRSILAEDIDGDGDMDLFVVSGEGDVLLYENVEPSRQRFISHHLLSLENNDIPANTLRLANLDTTDTPELVLNFADGGQLLWIPSIQRHYEAISGEAFSVTESASDADGNTLSYAISGGVDAEQFIINANTGELQLKQIPVFDRPGDSNQDNLYEVWIRVSDGENRLNRSISVSVLSP